MRVRVEVRKARRRPNRNPRRFPRVALDHLRGILVLDDRTRVVLATVALPLMNEADVAALVRGSAKKIREHVADETLSEALLGTLAAQAELHLESAEEQARRLAQHAALRARLKRLVGAAEEQEAGDGVPATTNRPKEEPNDDQDAEE